MSLAVPTSSEFPTLAREGLVYLDTAATSQTVRPALEAMDRYYETYRASIHRGIYPIAAEATDAYEARARQGRRVHELDARRDGLHPNATEAINLVAYAWGRANVGAGRPRGASRRWSTTRTSSRGSCSAAGWPTCRSPTTACWTSTRSTSCSRRARSWSPSRTSPTCSGTINPVAEIAARAHAAGALVLVDGAQAVPSPAGRRRRARRRLLRLDRPQGLRADRHRRAARPPRAAGGDAAVPRRRAHDRPRRRLRVHLGRAAGEVRGGHDADRRGDRPRRGGRLAGRDRHGRRARARPRRHGATRSSACPRCRGSPSTARATSTSAARSRSFALDGIAPARRRRDPRPRGRLRARRPPLRAAADAPPRRRRPRRAPRSPSTTRARTSTA